MNQRALIWKFTGGIVVLGVSILLLFISANFAGPIDTIAYTVLFLIGLAGIPTVIGLFSPSFPMFLRKLFGKLNFILGQIALGGSVLVQRSGKWEMCPLRKADGEYQAFIDDEWHGVVGDENVSILGWQRFGILRYKEPGALREERVDPVALQQMADGGEMVKRAGYEQAKPAVVDTDAWYIDLKRVFARGLQNVGDIDLIEKIEEITMRNETSGGRIDGWEPIIATATGIVLGVATAYLMI